MHVEDEKLIDWLVYTYSEGYELKRKIDHDERRYMIEDYKEDLIDTVIIVLEKAGVVRAENEEYYRKLIGDKYFID